MTFTRMVELDGHIIDSGMTQQAMGIVMDPGGSFDVEQFDIDRRKDEPSYCRMSVSADSRETLQETLHELHQIGADLTDPIDTHVEASPADRVVPVGFYSTTNHPTGVRCQGGWLLVEDIGMDYAIVIEETDDGPRASTEILNDIEEGDLAVTDKTGIRVKPPECPRDASGPFGFMQSSVSSERPLESLIEEAAEASRETKANNGNVLVVAGPALIHSGDGDALAELVREGYVDMISASNGFATHDIERGLCGTSLGMGMEIMEHSRKGHRHHIYTISEVIRAGSIVEAVEEGPIESGVMYEYMKHDVPCVSAGSIRDDGPLPDTIADTIGAQNAIREQAHRADMVLALSTLLHSVAVGNCLPPTVKTVCVDINPAAVTQLLDRGFSQTIGVVTDIGTFVPTLAEKVLGADGDNDGN